MTTSPHKAPLLRKNIGELLREIRVPAKSDNEWRKLENDMFLRLDPPESSRTRLRFTFAIPQPAIAWACAAALALLVTGAGLSVLRSGLASTAGLVSVKGNILVTWGGKGAPQTVGALDNTQASMRASAGTVFETPGNGSAIIRLDKGSVLELLPGSRLFLKASNASKQVCLLSTGSVIVKVNKRTHGQKFEIRTPCASCSVIGTIFQVDAQASLTTTLSVYHGKVKLTPLHGVKGVEAFVETGHRLCVGVNAKPVAGLLASDESAIHDISLLGMLVDAPENANGLFDIVSMPSGAKILINGAMAGKAPLIVREARGRYSLVVCADGCHPWDTTVTIGDNRVCEVRAFLSPLAGAAKPLVQASRRPAWVKPFLVGRENCESELQLMPDYVEALVDISSGEYQAALAIFDSLSNSGLVDIKARMCLMDKINASYSKLGDFEKASEALEDRYQKAQTPQDKGQLLWEMATMRANCLGDYQGAEMALVEFLILQPNAIWAHSAYGKLAEIQYYLNKYDVAAETYKRHIATFPDDPDIDKSLFNLACILGRDLNECEKAARWYSRLIDSFHTSKYRAAAFFRRGECELHMGKTAEAQRDFSAYLKMAPDGAWREACSDNIRQIKSLQ
jgi:tetratricopeptide (TPR) repeat protein